jgi:hypothetical protein
MKREEHFLPLEAGFHAEAQAISASLLVAFEQRTQGKVPDGSMGCSGPQQPLLARRAQSEPWAQHNIAVARLNYL